MCVDVLRLLFWDGDFLIDGWVSYYTQMDTEEFVEIINRGNV